MPHRTVHTSTVLLALLLISQSMVTVGKGQRSEVKGGKGEEWRRSKKKKEESDF